MLTNAQLDQVLRICGRDPRTVTGSERLRLRAKYEINDQPFNDKSYE